MGRMRNAAVGAALGLLVAAGCAGPYRPMMYRQGEGPPMDFGMPVTEGPILASPGVYPGMPGMIPAPGSVVTPNMPPVGGPPAPIMPPASGSVAPPLNAPPIGPMPRPAPTAQGTAGQPRS